MRPGPKAGSNDCVGLASVEALVASMRPGPKAGSNAVKGESTHHDQHGFNEARPEGRE